MWDIDIVKNRVTKRDCKVHQLLSILCYISLLHLHWRWLAPPKCRCLRIFKHRAVSQTNGFFHTILTKLGILISFANGCSSDIFIVTSYPNYHYYACYILTLPSTKGSLLVRGLQDSASLVNREKFWSVEFTDRKIISLNCEFTADSKRLVFTWNLSGCI